LLLIGGSFKRLPIGVGQHRSEWISHNAYRLVCISVYQCVYVSVCPSVCNNNLTILEIHCLPTDILNVI